MSDNNSITLIGRVKSSPYSSHKYDDSIVYAFDLEVNRNYDQVDIFDIIRVYTTDNIVEVDERYEIDGIVISSRLDNKPNVAVLANSITEVDDDTEDENKLHLSGSIVSISEPRLNNTNKLYQSMILRVDDSRVTIRLQALEKVANYSANNIKDGDEVTIDGSLQSDRVLSVKDRNSNDVYYLIGLISYINKDDRVGSYRVIESGRDE